MQLYYMPGGPEKKLSSRDCSKYFNIVDEKRWDTFDDYAQHIRTVHYVEWSKECMKSRCSCIHWAKDYFCKHVVGLAVFKNKVTYQESHMTINIEVSRKRQHQLLPNKMM